MSLLMTLKDQPGALHDVLKYFWKNDINISRIESRPMRIANGETGTFDFFVDFESPGSGDLKTSKLLTDIDPLTSKVMLLDPSEVFWFPRHINELDLIANRVLDAGTDLESDHPGFNDPTYRARRKVLAKVAREYVQGTPIPVIDYTPAETETWAVVWDRMEPLLDTYACKEYKDNFAAMRKNCGYSRDNIPQQQDITDYLLDQTGFRMRPVAGLLSSRDFLNGLAFRVFFSTQYIRHSSMPLYTPEPDICHELLGHAPMFLNKDFADFSQEIGLASLGATDDDIQRLAMCYWFSVEFGLCKEEGSETYKAYGAGLLSSFGELEYACAPYRPAGGTDERPEILPWDPLVAGGTAFPITKYQPKYFLADSLNDAKLKMRSYCEELKRPFFCKYEALTGNIWIDRPVSRNKGRPDPNAAKVVD
jgi:phenylalanine-4-hydroxylase